MDEIISILIGLAAIVGFAIAIAVIIVIIFLLMKFMDYLNNL